MCTNRAGRLLCVSREKKPGSSCVQSNCVLPRKTQVRTPDESSEPEGLSLELSADSSLPTTPRCAVEDVSLQFGTDLSHNGSGLRMRVCVALSVRLCVCVFGSTSLLACFIVCVLLGFMLVRFDALFKSSRGECKWEGR